MYLWKEKIQFSCAFSVIYFTILEILSLFLVLIASPLAVFPRALHQVMVSKQNVPVEYNLKDPSL